MNLNEIYEHIQAAQTALGEIITQEEERATTNPTIYLFVYEQFFPDKGVWAPNDQEIYAYDIEGAFSTLGHIIKVYTLTLRNIRYGPYEEMREEKKWVREYWNAELRKEKEG